MVYDRALESSSLARTWARVVPSSWVSSVLIVLTFDVDTPRPLRETEIWTWIGKRRRQIATVDGSLEDDRGVVGNADGMAGMMVPVRFLAQPDRLPWPRG